MEVLLSIAIFTIGVVGIGLFMIDIMGTAEKAQNLNQAILLADEGLEAVKSIRDESFDDVVVGTFGATTTGGSWSLIEDEPDVNIIGKTFTRTITISLGSVTEPPESATTSVMQIKSNVTWPMRSGTGDVSLYTFITNWNR